MVNVKNLAYEPLPGHYDELMAPDGSVRPHWRPLVDVLEGLGPDELNRRVHESVRMVRDNGATFQFQKDVGVQRERPWPLDLIPMVIDRAEWDALAQGVAQRARLLNMILADLYGPQKLLRDRLLPAELLYAHPRFLRPCSGIEPIDGVWLTVYALDLARSEDGSWWILSDRTDAPTGSGFALENRLVTNRALSEAFEASSVRRLSGYFRTHRSTLARLAPRNQENPRIVLLSPGPETETYFEQALLSRYLGYTLVEGSDLVVRDHRVFLKTLGGLLPVDVVWRRQDSESCDSLELGGGSSAGAPGLLDCVRGGHVTIANALGSGLAESPALMAFLPNLANHLIGEDLRIPSVATWWCGQEGPRTEVLDRLGELVIKPAFPGPRRERRFGHELGGEERMALRDDILGEPRAYLAQEQIPLSTTPVGIPGSLSPRFMVIRAFAVSDGQSYAVMPGGLGRVSPSTASYDVTVLGGGSSKDIWVVGESDELPVTLLPSAPRPIDVSRATFDLPSRVAENLYWLGRYAERLDAAARLIRATLPLLFGESSRSSSALSGALSFLEELGYAEHKAEWSTTRELEDALERAIGLAVAESDRKGSFGWQIFHLHRKARSLGDRLSVDAWNIISQLESDYAAGNSLPLERGLPELLDRIVIALTGFSGAVGDAMTRGHGWRFLDIGRRIERALQVIELLRHGLFRVAEDERARIELLLVAADSTMTYRSRYLTSLQANLTMDLLLIDEANPRGLAFQLRRLKEHVERLPDVDTVARRSAESWRLTDAMAAVELAEIELLARVEDGRRDGLGQLLDRVSGDLSQLSEHLTRDYLTHARPSPQ